ncbi:GDYXXLXY domain-containing protein [Serratia sp. DD3]|uniref:GDYXXLXY domain-containing protein n=1 Tax=Serratia sp. DD3 TaxID=1410619 RepID=UPI0003C52191|nr:GDYXXLXY domain-containing protein [Serratia sp. DD3]KEY57679.1 putative membrane-anchored protein [Serratia sp. DD3]
MQTKSVMKWLMAGIVLLVLIIVNLSIYQKERLLKHGTVVILELAPVDPRSLMQGDYMALNYALNRQLLDDGVQQSLDCQNDATLCTEPVNREKIVVELDAQHRAVNASFYRGQPLKAQEVLMKYHLSNGWLNIGTPSYFFQEGDAERFADARYGEFRVGQDGTAILTYLLDAQGKRILP